MQRWKQLVKGALVAVALAGGTGAAMGQERDKNWSVTVGLKAWQTTWETFLINQDPSTGNDNNIALTSDTGPLGSIKFSLIPSLTLRYHDVFVSVNYFPKTSYSFGEVSVNGKRIDTKASREEMDFNLGWFVFQPLALTVGYKAFKLEHELSSPNFPASNTRYTTNYGGFTVGGFASAPLGGAFALYANGTAGPTTAKYSNSGTYKGYYVSNEFGIAYAVAKGAVLSFGPKQQWLSTQVGNQTGRDVTTGWVFGGNYTF